MATLCTHEDVFRYGLPRGAVSQPGRVLSGVNVADNYLELGSHNLQLDTPVALHAPDGGRVPAPIPEATTLFAIPVYEDRLRLALVRSDAPGYAPIVLADVGAGRVLLSVSLLPQLDAFIGFYSQWAITNTPGNGPFTGVDANAAPADVPDELRMLVAVRAGAAFLRAVGKSIPTVFEQEAQLLRDWARMQRGVSMRTDSTRTNNARGATPGGSLPRTFS